MFARPSYEQCDLNLCITSTQSSPSHTPYPSAFRQNLGSIQKKKSTQDLEDSLPDNHTNTTNDDDPSIDGFSHANTTTNPVNNDNDGPEGFPRADCTMRTDRASLGSLAYRLCPMGLLSQPIQTRLGRIRASVKGAQEEQDQLQERPQLPPCAPASTPFHTVGPDASPRREVDDRQGCGGRARHAVKIVGKSTLPYLVVYGMMQCYGR
ncbi:hypothetical protein M378DRAFT_27135 [Amanita muscaria Koide BX008]|uniref:Uncharacterized protein n=1 Tax=Amanita muscaria (strain Koide BX008) TaxID=946122 RepID=A0A0C2SYJ8_AMAMK|nr:hypothetical protein M378DRAFT_27135 [Amanita muscaria Koide BX008]